MPTRFAVLGSMFVVCMLVVGCSQSNDSGAAPTSPTLPSASAGCDALRAEFAIGQSASADLLERSRAAAGARSARFLRPNQIITLEYLGTRLNLNLDEKDVVRSATCG